MFSQMSIMNMNASYILTYTSKYFFDICACDVKLYSQLNVPISVVASKFTLILFVNTQAS